MHEDLFSRIEEFLRCTRCPGRLAFDSSAGLLTCRSDTSHSFPVLDGIPSFVKEGEISAMDARWVFEYDEKSEQYDQAVKGYDTSLGVNVREEFARVMPEIRNDPHFRVLDVGTGTGAVILGLLMYFPDFPGQLVGTDLSLGMMRVAQRKLAELGAQVPLFHSTVARLPFEDDSFDLLTHVGGINTFSNIPAAIREWVRVLKPGGTLFFADEGLSPAARKSRRGAEIIRSNMLFMLNPPLEQLPPQVKKIRLQWVARDSFYVIQCQKLSVEELGELEPWLP